MVVVHKTKLLSNQVYLDFKKLYDLKPVIEQAGLYHLLNNNVKNQIQI
jgi:hypothetical protein